jgi:uncharacterized membrane protein YsdA (DUF1294 family)
MLGWIAMGAAVVPWAWWLGRGGAVAWPALVYLPASLVTVAAYGLDKRRARRAGARRIRERTLHLLELFGGWPGALWAQQAFRHKTRDRAFRLVFWALVGLHLLAWAAWASRP